MQQTLRWGGEGIDEASQLIGVSSGSGGWGSHLLVGELEPLFNGHMAHEGFTDRVRGVVAGWNEDGIF